MADEFTATEIAFLGEQDGPVERELKAKFSQCFSRNLYVNAAYLVRVRYGRSPEIKVALCLEAPEEMAPAIVEELGSEFREMFNSRESLDIMFLSEERKRAVTAVAKPFYQQHSQRA